MTPNPERQMKILDYFIAYKKTHDGNSPTIREIGQELGISSTSVVHYHLEAMVKKGMLYKIGTDINRAYCVFGGQWIYAPEMEKTI